MSGQSTHDIINNESDGPASVCAAVVTISSGHSLSEDSAGDAIVAAFDDGEQEIVIRELIESGHDNVQAKISRLIDRDDVDIVVTTGGTGVEPTDSTIEAVRPLLEKELPSFLTLFHDLVGAELGTRVLGSRVLAGVADGVFIFCLPNDPTATRLASESIIVPEAERLVGLASGAKQSSCE